MTDDAEPSSGALEEIRRLAGIAGAEYEAEQAVVARKRKLFGPLFYSTLVLGAIATVYVGSVRVGELVEFGTNLPASNAESVFATGVAALSAKNWQERAAGARAIKASLLQFGAGDNRSASRVETVKALCGALADKEAPVRADAADALGTSQQLAEMAKSELTAALKDDDPTVRLAAARSLMRMRDEPNDAAVQDAIRLAQGSDTVIRSPGRVRRAEIRWWRRLPRSYQVSGDNAVLSRRIPASRRPGMFGSRRK